MKFFNWEIRKAVAQNLTEEKANQFDDVLMRIMAAQKGFTNWVTPENCESAPTVKAIVTAITRRFSVTPVHVYQKGRKDNRDTKERLPNHPVAKLLAYPNSWQSRVDYWQDAASWMARYGRYYAYKSRGTTGPIRELLPIVPSEIAVEREPNTWDVTYRRGNQVWTQDKLHVVRGPARDGICGDSPVTDVAQAIALEMAAEKFGAMFFQNGAVPLLVFTYLAGSQGFKTKEEKDQFIDDFQSAFSGEKSHRAMVAPKGFDKPTSIPIENDRAQFLETRKYQRTVIAGAWGVPPHLVGDLERATFNNVEQQDSDFTLNVIMPIGQQFEAAMERDLLTDDDVNSGVIIRFNFDAILRADFKSRQEGLQIQRQNGAISPNEWREKEGMNPIDPGKGGDEYIRPANMVVAGEPAPLPKPVDASLAKLKAVITQGSNS